MNTDPLIDLIKQNFSDLESLQRLQSAINGLLLQRIYQIALLNGESPEWPPVLASDSVCK